MNSEITALLFELIISGKATIPESQETSLLTLLKRLDFGGIIYTKAKGIQLPNEIQNFCKNSYYRNFIRNKQLLEFYAEVESILTKNNISFQPLKGIWLLQNVYSEYIGIRFLSDVDILIRPTEKDKVTNILLSDGYELRDYGLSKINPSQESFCKNDLKIDLHYEIKELKNIDLEYILGLTPQKLLALQYVIHILHLHRHLRAMVYRPIWVHDCFEILQLLKLNNIEIDTSFLDKNLHANYRLVHSFIEVFYLNIQLPKHKLGFIFHEDEKVALYEFKLLMYHNLFDNALKINRSHLEYLLASELSKYQKFKLIIKMAIHNLVRLLNILGRL